MIILEEIRNELNAEFNLLLQGRSQSASLVMPRKAYINALRPHFTLMQIGSSLNRNHSTVYQHSQMHDEYMRQELYKSVYLRTQELYRKHSRKAIDTRNLSEILTEMKKQIESLEQAINEINIQS
jgi:IS30 family transposase